MTRTIRTRTRTSRTSPAGRHAPVLTVAVVCGASVLTGMVVGLAPASRASTVPTPSEPGAGYELTWEDPADRTVPEKAPPGWAAEYSPQAVHADGEPQVRVADLERSEPVRAGSHSVRFELDRDDTPLLAGPRAEIGAEDPVEPRGAERWYGFSTYLPQSWQPDPTAEIIAQWHQVGEECSRGCSPPLSLFTRDGQFYLSQNWQNRAGVPGDWTFQDTAIGPYTTGRWTDWVVHVKWSTGDDGLLEVWRDGRPVPGFEHKVGRTDDFGDQQHGNYLKLGIYKWAWKGDTTTTTNRVLFHDELRITDGSGSYAKVAPPAVALPGGGQLALGSQLWTTPGRDGAPTRAEFTVTNVGPDPLTVPYFLVGVRTAAGGNADLPASAPVTLQPGASFTYRGGRDLPPGTYRAWPALYDGTRWIELGAISTLTVP